MNNYINKYIEHFYFKCIPKNIKIYMYTFNDVLCIMRWFISNVMDFWKNRLIRGSIHQSKGTVLFIHNLLTYNHTFTNKHIVSANIVCILPIFNFVVMRNVNHFYKQNIFVNGIYKIFHIIILSQIDLWEHGDTCEWLKTTFRMAMK